MPKPKTSPKPKTVPPRAYLLHDTGLPFSRGTWFRWEKSGVIPPLVVNWREKRSPLPRRSMAS